MKMKAPLKAPDLAVIFLALGLTGLSAYSVYARPENAASVTITGPGQEWIFPLDAEETVTVRGPLGNTNIRIHGNEAWVEESPCENQTCVAGGRVSRNGGWAACLPNGVFFVISNQAAGGTPPLDELDAMAW